MSDNPEKLAFAARLNEICDDIGLPKKGKGRQTSLAKLVEYSQNAVLKWLEGDGYPKLDKARDLAALANVNIDWLMTGRGAKHPPPAVSETSLHPYNAGCPVQIAATQLAADAQAIASAWLRLPEHRRQRLLAQIVAEASAAGHTTTAEQITGDAPDMSDNPPRHIIPSNGFSAVEPRPANEQKKSPGGKPGEGQ